MAPSWAKCIIVIMGYLCRFNLITSLNGAKISSNIRGTEFQYSIWASGEERIRLISRFDRNASEFFHALTPTKQCQYFHRHILLMVTGGAISVLGHSVHESRSASETFSAGSCARSSNRMIWCWPPMYLRLDLWVLRQTLIFPIWHESSRFAELRSMKRNLRSLYHHVSRKSRARSAPHDIQLRSKAQNGRSMQTPISVS
jgi:hypothetical protein